MTTTTTALAATDLERLRDSLRGPVIDPDEEGYDAARAIWNGAIDRRPACIARCTGVADVVAAVRFARERDLLVGVRSGGHGVGGHAVCDGGLVIDLSPMRGIRVDPATRTARAEAGVLWGSSTARRSSSGWRRSAGSSPTRGSRASPSAGGSAG